MFTITPVLISSKVNSRGLSPIKLLITIGRKQTLQSIGIRINSDHWKDGQVVAKAPNAKLINAAIRQRANELEAQLLEAELKHPLTIRRVSEIIRGKQESTTVKQYIESVIVTLKGKYSHSRLQSYQHEINRLDNFSPSVAFSDIDAGFLRRYEAHLRSLQLSPNTIHKIWKILRRFFNLARQEGLTDHYPFAGYDNPKYSQVDKEFLYPEEVEQLEAVLKLPLKDYQRVTALYFLLGCYSGLRFSDWQRFNPAFIQGERLVLRTKKNGELVSWIMHPKLKAIVKEVLQCPPIYANATTNEYLKGLAKLSGIKKHLTVHGSRHTFAVGCALRNIPKEDTAELMGITLKTVNYYYRVVSRRLDEQAAKWK